MDEYEGLESVISTLSPRQWYDIARAADDGPLGPCCANISELRDDLLAFLRSPVPIGAMELARKLTDGSHDFEGPIADFTKALCAHLSKCRPNWRAEVLPDDDDVAELMAWGSLAIRRPFEPVGERPPTEWLPVLAGALQAIAAPPGEVNESAATAWLIAVQGGLGAALLAGAPAQACMSAFDVARRTAYVAVAADGQEG